MARLYCGVEGCGAEVRAGEEFILDVPADFGRMPIDLRRRTPTGGRFGASAVLGRRSFIKMKRVVGCVSCSLKFKNVKWPRKESFERRCKKGGRG